LPAILSVVRRLTEVSLVRVARVSEPAQLLVAAAYVVEDQRLAGVSVEEIVRLLERLQASA
ncbi:MAG: hypothetical protein VYE22_04465, partial [Myxococcota bacterium]|nr:hypothetical protein [Myxococcota bacterium]